VTHRRLSSVPAGGGAPFIIYNQPPTLLSAGDRKSSIKISTAPPSAPRGAGVASRTAQFLGTDAIGMLPIGMEYPIGMLPIGMLPIDCCCGAPKVCSGAGGSEIGVGERDKRRWGTARAVVPPHHHHRSPSLPSSFGDMTKQLYKS